MNNRLNQFAERADSFIDSHLPQTEEAQRRRKNRILRPLAVVAGLSVAFGAYKGVEAAVSTPEFSDTTITYNVEQGDGMQTVVSHIDNINEIDWREAATYVSQMPENQEVLSDGLQPGEQVILPESVKR